MADMSFCDKKPALVRLELDTCRLGFDTFRFNVDATAPCHGIAGVAFSYHDDRSGNVYVAVFETGAVMDFCETDVRNVSKPLNENFDVMDRLPMVPAFGDEAGYLAPHVFHLLRGHVYDIAGHSLLAMGGAHSLDAARLRASGAWWEREVTDADERAACDEAVRRAGHVDVVATHAPPAHQLVEHALDREVSWRPDEWNQWLQDHIADRLSFGRWFYGHMHDDRPWEGRYIPLMHVIYDYDGRFPGRLWGPESELDWWEPGEPF